MASLSSFIEHSHRLQDSRLVAGAGGAELELAHELADFGRRETGLAQYAIAKFAESLEVQSS